MWHSWLEKATGVTTIVIATEKARRKRNIKREIKRNRIGNETVIDRDVKNAEETEMMNRMIRPMKREDEKRSECVEEKRGDGNGAPAANDPTLVIAMMMVPEILQMLDMKEKVEVKVRRAEHQSRKTHHTVKVPVDNIMKMVYEIGCLYYISSSWKSVFFFLLPFLFFAA